MRAQLDRDVTASTHVAPMQVMSDSLRPGDRVIDLMVHLMVLQMTES